MSTLALTIDKINSLNDENKSMVISFVDYLVNTQSRNTEQTTNVFRKAREACQGKQMSDEEIDDAVSEIKAERNAARG